MVYCILHLLYTMLYQKAAGKVEQIGLHCRPSSSASSDEDSNATGRSATSSSSSGDPRPIASQPGASWGPWRDPGYGWGETACTNLLPSSGLAKQVGTERSIFHASQFAEGLVKQLDGPSLWFVLWPERREQPWLERREQRPRRTRGTRRSTWTQLAL